MLLQGQGKLYQVTSFFNVRVNWEKLVLIKGSKCIASVASLQFDRKNSSSFLSIRHSPTFIEEVLQTAGNNYAGIK